MPPNPHTPTKRPGQALPTPTHLPPAAHAASPGWPSSSYLACSGPGHSLLRVFIISLRFDWCTACTSWVLPQPVGCKSAVPTPPPPLRSPPQAAVGGLGLCSRSSHGCHGRRSREGLAWPWDGLTVVGPRSGVGPSHGPSLLPGHTPPATARVINSPFSKHCSGPVISSYSFFKLS